VTKSQTLESKFNLQPVYSLNFDSSILIIDPIHLMGQEKFQEFQEEYWNLPEEKRSTQGYSITLCKEKSFICEIPSSSPYFEIIHENGTLYKDHGIIPISSRFILVISLEEFREIASKDSSELLKLSMVSVTIGNLTGEIFRLINGDIVSNEGLIIKPSKL
jgi:hypothetical protein